MADHTIKLDVTGSLDPDATLFALCMHAASQFENTTFTEFASRVETLIEICENMDCQRMTLEADAE